VHFIVGEQSTIVALRQDRYIGWGNGLFVATKRIRFHLRLGVKLVTAGFLMLSIALVVCTLLNKSLFVRLGFDQFHRAPPVRGMRRRGCLAIIAVMLRVPFRRLVKATALRYQ
jgi:hypothetical protein